MTIGSNEFVLFLMGPTASGKTELAIEISKLIDSKIISVDSALVYRGMDIGTAKPDKETLKKFPHELIDICEPEDSFSVNDFIDLATTQIELAFKENKLPILVGGTSFYFNALEHGISNLPASTDKSRKHFNDQLKKLGSEKLHDNLKEVDPKSAARIHPNDSQRITRALEVYDLSGETLSSLQGKKNHKKLNLKIKKIILMPKRSELHERIEERFIDMIKNGFLDGRFIHYSASFKKIREYGFLGGEKHGLATLYYPDGRLRSTTPWYQGMRDGNVLRYSKDLNQKITTYSYKEGKIYEISK